MGEESGKTQKKNMKAKRKRENPVAETPRIDDKPKKRKRIDGGEVPKLKEVEGSISGVGNPWSNLDLVLSLQNREIGLSKKVELAFSYVELRARGGGDVEEEDSYEVVKRPRLVGFLSDWVQSLLVSVGKGSNAVGEGEREVCLDYRCWVVFKFCLEESLLLDESLSLSRNLLRAIGTVARSAAGAVKEGGVSSLATVGLYRVAVDCVALVFLSHDGLSNESLDLWVSAVGSVLEVANEIVGEEVEGVDVRGVGLRFACLVLEQFAKFLRVHPARKNGFRDFVDKLLEPLLSLLSGLGGFPGGDSLLNAAEEVLLQGLFHPVHVDGFLSLPGMEKYATPNDGLVEDRKADIRSYHRHVFDKVENMSASNKSSALNGLGKLFHLLVDRVKRQRHKEASLLSEETKTVDKSTTSGSPVLNNLNAENRRSLFGFFVQILEPLLFKMDGYLHKEWEDRSWLVDVRHTVKAINNLLATLSHDKLYLKTEDNYGGACLNFLKKVHNSIINFASILLGLSKTHEIGNGAWDVPILVAEDLFVCIEYFLDIDYEVIHSNVEGLWLMMLQYMALSHLFQRSQERRPLTSQILKVGRLLIELYSEVRQVMIPVFALCKATRSLVVWANDPHSEFPFGGLHSGKKPVSSEACIKVVGALICTQEIRRAIHNGIKSTPEGQVSEFIRELGIDLSESIEWLKSGGSLAGKNNCSEANSKASFVGFIVQSELLGRGLSEIYGSVLDSVNVTVGNSILVGRSIEHLMSIIRPYASTLVAEQSDGDYDFLSSVMGGSFSKIAVVEECNRPAIRATIQWVFAFFFRLYVSCRSLYRQTVVLMPPVTSKKMSTAMGDSVIAYAGNDWMAQTNWMNEGYFSWIIQSSATLLFIIRSISETYLQGYAIDCCNLIYLFHAMVVQRLSDLNRQINSLEYLLQSSTAAGKIELLENANPMVYRKRSRKWRKHILVQKQEAAELADFLMRHLSVTKHDQLLVDGMYDKNHLDACDQSNMESGIWCLRAGSLNEKSLPIAIWVMLCQNIDIWSAHASKGKLKVFLGHLVYTSLPCITRGLMRVERQSANEDTSLDKNLEHQISSQVLSDSGFYEHKFVCRHLASRICHLLEKSVPPSLEKFLPGDNSLGSSPCWQEVLSTLENLSTNVKKKLILDDRLADGELTLPASFELRACIARATSTKFSACERLLRFLCWMPKEHISSRSVTLYVTCLLNLERVLIGGLSECHDALSLAELPDLLRLLVSCRRALKCIVMALYEKKSPKTKCLLIPMLAEDPYSALWLLKSTSLVIELQELLPAEERRDKIFSLMDHTSYVFLTISKCQHGKALGAFTYKTCLKENSSLVSEVLKEHTQGLLSSIQDFNEKMGHGASATKLSQYSLAVSCFGGFLWGLTSVLGDTLETDGGPKEIRGIWTSEAFLQISDAINRFSELSPYLLQVFHNGEGHGPESEYVMKQSEKSAISNDLVEIGQSSFKRFSEAGISTNGEQHNRRESMLKDANSLANLLGNIESAESLSINESLLGSLLEGAYPEAAILLRQLLIASAAILRLKSQKFYIPWSSNSMLSFVGISQFLLSKFSDMNEVPPFSFVWLDGALKYLQELGSLFSLTSPTLTRDSYTKMIELLLKALGRCISAQGNLAILASHENESNMKISDRDTESSDSSISFWQYCLSEFKTRLRLALISLIRKPSELHLLSAIEATEKAIVGVHDGSSTVYEVTMGDTGGTVSSSVAASIDFLDLLLEHVSGRKSLSLVKGHMQSLIAALFSIILHLRSPSIFNCKPSSGRDAHGPHSGAVILMSVEVLTRISAKHALLQMDSWHVAETLRIPGALFQEFGTPGAYGGLVSSSGNLEHGTTGVDQQLAIRIFSACCRLLYTTLKHHKSESERCISLLQDSTRVLLCCLEMEDANLSVGRSDLRLGVQGGLECACSFRRIYEELRQQREVFGKHCFKFLSEYIWVYSRYGPLKAGIRREIDDALRPGLYALLDACSADDLQYLHSVLGEGPCRNTLATLQHDYRLNFRYEGKV